jgi:hypothetical protein
VAKWTNTTSYPNLPAPADDDLLPIADVSEASGSQQRTITWSQLTGLQASELGDLTDVDVYGVSDGQVLTFDSATGDWVAETPSVGGDVSGPGSSTSGNIAEFDGAGGDTLADSGTTVEKLRTQSFIIACSDETTDLAGGTAKVTFRMPYAFTLTAVRASVTTAPTGANLEVDINEGASSVLSTVISIDAGDKTSVGATTAAVISDSSLADDAEITIDIDQIGSTVAGAGLKVALIGYAT